MSLSARLLPRLALLVVIALYALRWEHWLVSGLFAALAIVSVAPRRGFALSGAGQGVLALVGAGLVYPALIALVPTSHDWVSRFGVGLVLTSCFLALPRHFLASPWMGQRGNAALHLFVLIGCTQGSDGLIIVPFTGLYLAVQLAALRAVDPGRAPLRKLTPRHWAAAAAILLATVAVGTGLSLTIPPAQKWAMKTAYRSFLSGRTGFSSDMNLGAMDDMYQSDEMVMRVYGPKPDHLRGVVFTRYREGRWLEARGATRRQEIKLKLGKMDRTRVITLGGDRRRYFVPLRARAVTTDLGEVQVSEAGVFTTPPGEEALEVSFLPGRRERFSSRAPDKDDLEVPRGLSPTLREFTDRWITGEATAAQRLALLEGRLQREFQYALTFDRKDNVDPILDFLQRSKEGHCEYFASAMTLLARTAGVPARVVSGFRVREFNTVGGYYVVRERNAHSWVEGWVEGQGWQTYDPTPPAAMESSSRREMSTVAAVVDVALEKLRQAWAWVTGLSFLQLGGSAASLILLWVLVRLLRGRRQVLKARAMVLPLSYRDPVPALERLLEVMAGRGVPRRTAEPLEQYAGRLRQEGGAGDDHRAAVGLILRYAAWRYGGEGDGGALAGELEAFLSTAGEPAAAG